MRVKGGSVAHLQGAVGWAGQAWKAPFSLRVILPANGLVPKASLIFQLHSLSLPHLF